MAALMVIIFAVSGCGSNGEANRGVDGFKEPWDPGQVPGEAGATDPMLRELGQTVTLRDDGGHPLQVTPTGVAYRDAFAKDKTLPLEGKYALVVAFTMRSETGGRLLGRMDNHLKWSRGPEMVEAWDYEDAPWRGCIDEYTPFVKIKAGEEYKAIVDFNVPAQGGILLIEDKYGSLARWKLPTTDTGTGTEPATKYTTENC
ncbi:hypothetical protein [Streptomyces sp. Isolate_45]|uniref:hypothetical protein n=1 Tax=Streptomyces sp. Isolate_45 TaxID=2950111 RepID=UPI002481EC21|nr:hypothetical protein [Streptomyces sp. Isolate_45]MDA5280037.1 hypothetical protein [Streptomyces sp. Isolate_45]